MKNKPSFLDILLKEADKKFERTMQWYQPQDEEGHKKWKRFLHSEIKRAVEAERENWIKMLDKITNSEEAWNKFKEIRESLITNSEGGTK